jgi:glycosyltransferase involved in cell wall biosynthesis
MYTPFVSVAICTKDRGDSILSALNSVLEMQYDNFEVIIVDQSTNDQTQCAITPLLSDTRVRYIRTTSVGKGRACNQALQEARGEIMAFTDDDCSVPQDWLTKLAAAFAQEQRIALVFCAVLPGEHDPTAGYIPVFEVKENRIIRHLKETL